VLAVFREIVVAAVGKAGDLDPVAPDLAFGVPAVGGIVCSLAGEMLAEAEPIHVDADPLVPALGDTEEVGDPRRGNDRVIDRLADGCLDILAVVVVLFTDRVERDLDVFDIVKRWLICLGIDELL